MRLPLRSEPVLRGLALLLTGGGLLAPGALRAQFGDRPEQGPQTVLAAAQHPVPSPLHTPEEELPSFRLPPGFVIELVAAEPLVHDPVAAAYDARGNLWVVEFSQFNAGMIKDLPALAAGAKASDVPSCKIVELESSRHDGHYDRRIVWLEGLEGAKGILPVRGGLLISDPPNLWLARDLHGTGRCDEKTLLLNNYEAWSDPEESGSLLWGRDNVIHDIDFPYDYRYRHGALERVPVPVRGQFGVTQDDYGRLFYARSTQQLRGDFYGPAYALRSANVFDVPWTNIEIAADEEVWPSHLTITNRGYRIGILGQRTDGVRPDGTLLEFTAACSPLIYRGRNFPADFYGNALVPEPAGNLIKRNLLVEAGGQFHAVNAYEGKEFLTSTDARFRPVDLINAPDGSLLVVDMCRGILEEYHYTTSYLRDQSLARGLDRPLFGPGRLWRIRYQGGVLDPRRPDLAGMSGPAVAALLEDPNGWWRDTAQQELVERGDWSAVPRLTEVAQHAADPVSRLAAWWTLDGLGATTPELLRGALADRSAKVRAVGVRLHERWLADASSDAVLRQLEPVLHDPADEVAVQLALTLGEAKGAAPLATMERLLEAAKNNAFVPKALLTGLEGREFDFYRRLRGDLSGLGPQPATLAMLTCLATAIVRQGDADSVHALIADVAQEGSLPTWARAALADGFQPLLTPAFRRAVGPSRLVKAAALAPWVASTDSPIHSAGARLSRGLAEEEEKTRQEEASAVPLTAEERKRYEQGRTTFQICAGCHQPAGTGMAHVAPSLIDSHWVASYPDIMIRVMLCGKEGTPGFPGPMPPIGGSLTDQQIADVATYVRNSWGAHRGPVEAATVRSVRDAVGNRQAPWTDAELRRVEGTLAEQQARAVWLRGQTRSH